MPDSPPDGNSAGSRAPASAPGVARAAAGRLGGLISSVMDLHVRIALQEADREKRRLIGGALLISGGLALLSLALMAAELALLLWFHQRLGWGWLQAALALATIDLVVAGLFLRVGGRMLQGPYLPQTMAGLSKTSRALLGR
ncbi:MAG: phage holin family protein [Cyanobacteriota bacterium]